MPRRRAISCAWSRLSLRDQERSTSWSPATSASWSSMASAIGSRSLSVSTALAMLNVITFSVRGPAAPALGAARAATAQAAVAAHANLPARVTRTLCERTPKRWIRTGALRRHAGELTPGDVQHLTVDEVRPRRAEEEHAPGRLLRRARTPERDQHRGHLAQLVRNAQLDLLAADLHRVRLLLGGGQAGLDVAERHGVDVDLELAPLLGQRLGQPDDPRLARRVVGLAGVAHRAGDRGDVDHLAEDLLALLALLLSRLAQVRRRGAQDPE